MELFGFTIGKKEEEKEQQNLHSFVPMDTEDGSIEIAPGGVYGTYMDFDNKAKNEGDLITRYRDMSVTPECDAAIQDIVNEAIIMSEDGDVIELDTSKIKQKAVQKKIEEEFDNIIKILKFNSKAYDIFRKWYVDGRLYYHIVVDIKNPKAGIQDLRYIDPRRIRKIKEPVKKKDPRTGAVMHTGTNEYYIYNAKGAHGGKPGLVSSSTQGLKIAKDSVAYCHSGMLDGRTSLVYSHLHKAMRTLNQLRMLEDSLVIYRISRAPERRIFYIDVGNLPKMKAEQVLREMQTKWKNKLVYDASTGQVKDDRRYLTMLEDFWLPRREGGRGTEITTLPGGQNLGEMEDVEYFRRKLYKALNVPISRLESENAFNLGRAQEITRDEVKFSKFIERLRAQFSNFFMDLMEIQLSLKGIVSRKDWQTLKQEISFDFQNDNHYQELKEAEVYRDRFSLLNEIDPFVGRYVSKEWVRKNILRLPDEDMQEMESEMEDDREEIAAMQQQQMDMENQSQSQEELEVDISSADILNESAARYFQSLTNEKDE
jgi:hypothetical protein